MLSNRTSQWSLATALLCVVVLAASWFLLISPRRATAADVRGEVSSAQSQSIQLQSKINTLKSEFADLPKSRAQLAAIKQQLPADANMPQFVRDLQTYATQAGVVLNSISPGTPVIETSTGAAVPVATPLVATAADPQLVQIPVGINVTGEYFETSLFVKYLQTKINRAYLVSGVAVTTTASASTPVTDTTSTSTASPGSTATATAAPTPSASATPDQYALAITGSTFVLLDGGTTLAQVAKEAKAAAVGTQVTVTPTTAPTAS